MSEIAETTVADWSRRQVKARRAPPLRFLIGGAIIALAIAYFIASNLGSSTVYYLTVTELKARDETAGQAVRVSGNVVPGTIDRDGSLVRFTIADPGGSLPVVYRGIVPDIFGDDAQVVVEGRTDADGTFQAGTLLAKCPSRFEAAAEAPVGSTGR